MALFQFLIFSQVARAIASIATDTSVGLVDVHALVDALVPVHFFCGGMAMRLCMDMHL